MLFFLIWYLYSLSVQVPIIVKILYLHVCGIFSHKALCVFIGDIVKNKVNDASFVSKVMLIPPEYLGDEHLTLLGKDQDL